MAVEKLSPISLGVPTISERIKVTATRGSFSIQPIVDNGMGSATYTLEVSNDDGKTLKSDDPDYEGEFIAYSPETTDVSIDDYIEVIASLFPWEYIRISVSTSEGDSGTVTFLINMF